MAYKRVFVSQHCRGPPSGRGIGAAGHAMRRDAEIARNYHKGETWYKGMSSDLWDSKSMTDRTLTRRENTKLKRDFWKNFR